MYKNTEHRVLKTHQEHRADKAIFPVLRENTSKIAYIKELG